MKHINYILIAILFCWVSLPSLAQTEDNKYLEGAVPEVNGKVVFAQTVHIPQTSKQDLFKQLEQWMEKRFNSGYSRVVYKDPDKGQLVAMGNDTLVFKASFLTLDQASMTYQFLAEVKDAECNILIERISYSYEEDKNYTAEEMITDRIALNKAKTKMYKGYAKWRIHTVDYMTNLLADATQHLYQLNQGATQRQEAVPMPMPVEAPQKVASESSLKTSTSPSNTESTLIPHVARAIERGNILVSTTVNGQPAHIPTQAIQIGKVYGKPVITLITDYGSKLYKALEANKLYTISFYADNYKENIHNNELKGLTPVTTTNGLPSFEQAEMVIECKALLSQSITPESISDASLREQLGNRALSKFYVSEITSIKDK